MEDTILAILEKLLELLEKNGHIMWVASIIGFILGCVATAFYYAYFRNYQIQRDLSQTKQQLETTQKTLAEKEDLLRDQQLELDSLRNERDRLRIRTAVKDTIPTY